MSRRERGRMKIMERMKVNSSSDPTNQGMNRRDAKKKLNHSVDRFEGWVYLWIDSIPVIQDEHGYNYQTPPLDSSGGRFETVALGLLLFDGAPVMSSNIEAAMRSGVLGAARDSEKQLSKLPQSYNFDSTFSSIEYQQKLSDSQAASQISLESNARESSRQILLVIMSMMGAGYSSREIKDEISESFEKLKRKNNRVVDTSISESHTDGIITSTVLAGLALGLSSFVKHISALTPTTRPHHAARHLKIYSVIDQERWWASGSNRINCKCSVKPVFK